MSSYIVKFDRFSDMVANVINNPPTGDIYNRSHDTGADFFGTETFEQAQDYATKGWPEGAQRVYAISHELETKFYNLIERRDITYDISGEVLDVARYTAGEPEHWGQWNVTQQEGAGTKYVSMVINRGATGDVDVETIEGRGAVIAALINLLEMAGCRVKVDLVFPSTVREWAGRLEIWAGLKEYDEGLDLDRLAFAVANPASHRRFKFGVMERFPLEEAKKWTASGTYGNSCNIKPPKGTDYYFEALTYSEPELWCNPEAAKQWVYDKLKQAGVLKADTVTA